MKKNGPLLALTDLVLRYRWPVLFLVLGISALMAWLGSGLPTDNSYDTWLPEKEYVAELIKETNREFSSNTVIFVVLDFPEKGVFHPESLREVDRFTELLETVPELFFVMSLTNIVDLRQTADGVAVGRLIPDIPEDSGALAGLRKYVLSKEMYVNTVVSEDARYTGILMNIDGSFDAVEVAARVLDLLQAHENGVKYYFGGDPALGHYTDLYMQRDLKVLVPCMLLVMSLVLGFGLRRAWAVALPLAMVFLSILWTLGFQRISHMPLNLLTPAVLVMLIAMGCDYSVHFINHYLRTGELRRAAAEISLPILMSALTTIAGLLMFATTQIQVINQFGYELAFGLAAACLLCMTFLTAVIRIVRMRPEGAYRNAAAEPSRASKGIEADDQEGHLFARFLGAVTVRILRHPWLFLLGMGIVVLGLALGIPRIHTNVDFETFLPKNSPPRVGHQILREHFGGIYPLSLYYRGDMEEPSLLTLQIRAENLLRAHPHLSGFNSLAGMIAEMNRLFSGIYALPEDRPGVASLWLLMEAEPYLKPLVNDERDKALLSAMIQESATDVMKELAGFVDRTVPVEIYEDVLTLDVTRLAPDGRNRIEAFQRDAAARQVAALAIGYAKGHEIPPPSFFTESLRDHWATVVGMAWTPATGEALRAYLQEQALRSLLPAAEEALIRLFEENFPKENPEAWLPAVYELLEHGEGMDPADAAILVEGALRRCQDRLRLAQSRLFLGALQDGLPEVLAEHTYFVRRAEGVLWEMLSARPVFLASALAGIPGVEAALVKRVPVKIDQTGFPGMIRKFDRLLYRSQVQSVFLAALVVFLLVSLTQRSVRRGLISITSVLVPLIMVTGLMGWLGIPLDFGTAIFGALIIGLGIDGCIHVLNHEARLRGRDLSEEQALVDTLRHVGRAVLTANITTAGGFAMLLFSSTSAVRNFAILNVAAIVLVTVSILTLLPVLIRLTHVFKQD